MINLSAFEHLYPFNSHYLSLDSHQYHYIDEGQGEPVVMVHGNPTWSFYYRNLVLGLRDSYRTIVPDHIGCGLSDKPAYYLYRLSQHIDNLEALLDHLKLDKVTLVVHDWGGAIGLGWAVRHPERVKRLVLLNTAAFRSAKMPLVLKFCRLPGVGTLAIRGLNAFAGLAVHMACKKKERMTPAVKAGYLAPYNSYANRIATLRFVEDIPLNRFHPSYHRLEVVEEGLPLLADKPMRIFWGGKDFVFTEHFLQRWQKLFPDAVTTRYPDAGHYLLEDAGEKILPLLQQFLQES